MNKKISLVLLVLLSNLSFLAQESIIKQAQDLFNSKKYSAAQALYNQLIIHGNSSEDIAYYHAKCSKELFLSDALFLYERYIEDYPYSQFLNNVNIDLAIIYFRDKRYKESIPFFEALNNLDSQNHLRFKLAYANFCIDSLSEAAYHFSKLMDIETKYASASRYYYACIAYRNGSYNSALNNFLELLDDKKFGNIVPYYITQIFFLQKKYEKLIDFTQPRIETITASRIKEISRILAESYLKVHDYKNTITYFNKYLILEDDPDPIIYFLLGQSYYNVADYENAVLQLEKVSGISDSIIQNSTYYLGASYLKLERYSYALQAFKKSSTLDYDLNLKEEAYFNYAKLSYQLDLPFDNTLEILRNYLEVFKEPLHKKEIENLMIETLQGTSQYHEAYSALKDIHLPDLNQKKALQQLSFFLGVQAYNSLEYKIAISYFSHAQEYQINPIFSYLNSFWLADCYFRLGNNITAAELYTNLPSSDDPVLKEYNILQKYNLAYCYFYQEEYKLSNKYFRIYEKIGNPIDSMYFNDIYLRIADGFFMNAEYSLSEQYYNKAIRYNLFDTDYAIYNRSVSLGLIGEKSLKVSLLRILKDNYKASAYYDDAVLDLASYYKNENNYDLALEYYNELLDISNSINLMANARLNKGMIYFNTNRIDTAIEEFLFVINNYQKTKYFKEALAGLQLAYSSLAKIDEYLAIIDELPEVSISRAVQDSLTYNTALMKFMEGDYHVANNTFRKYLEKFNQGIFVNEATYYNARSAVEIGDTISALSLYKSVVETGIYDYQELALIFLARISYKDNNFNLSNSYYQSLELIASNNALKREAVIRLMYGNENIDVKLAVKYARAVLNLDKTDNWLLSKANVIIARHEFNSGNYAKSRKTFKKVKALSNYEEGAEAKYYLAYLTYLDDSLDLAEQMIFQLAEDYTSDHFIAKGFLLLAEIYTVQNNNFQAKATLESIINNHEGEDLINLARKKWEQILEKEVVSQDAIEIQSYINISEEEIEYELEFDIDTIQVIDIDYEVQNLDTLEIINDSLNKNISNEDE